MKDLNTVASEYKPNAATEIENNLILRWYPQRIISRFGEVDSLLELGLGHGFTAEIFNKCCKRHVILDGASSVIAQFKSNHPDFTGEIVETYFEDYTPSEKFDVIVMGFILEHVDNPTLILKRYRDFLKPNGKMYVAVPNGKSLNRRLGFELGLIDDLYSLNANDLALGHQRQYCLETLRSEVIEAGYEVTHQEGIYLKPLPLATLKTLNDFDENLEAMCKVGVDFPELTIGILLEVIPV